MVKIGVELPKLSQK